MLGSKVIFVLSVIFAYSKSASIVDNIKKCALSDADCINHIYATVIQDIGDAGIPEMGIPPIDPYEIKNAEVTIMGMIKVIMIDGLAKGYKSCRSNKFNADLEKLIASIEVVCDTFSIDSTYKLESTPILEALIGGIKIHGEGKGGVSIENVQFNYEIPFEFKKLEDGEIHFVVVNDKVNYTFKILGKVVFHADNLYVGKQEISTVAINIMNENWEFFSNTLARSVTDKVVDTASTNFNKFFAAVPITQFITDDVTSLVTV